MYASSSLLALPRRLLVVPLVLVTSVSVQADPTGTLDRLVQQQHARFVKAVAGHKPASVDLALAVHRGPGEVPERLVDSVRELLTGKLSAQGFRSVTSLAVSGGAEQRRQRARAGGFELLLDLELSIHEGYLHLQGCLLATDRHLWRDMLRPRRGTLSHLHSSVRVDAEVRAFSGSVRSRELRFTPRRHAVSGSEVLALGVGDLDGDGRNELVALQRRSLAVWRWHRGKLEPVAALDLPPPAAAVRPRRGMGSMVLADTDGDGRVEVLARSSEMQQGAHLALDGKQLVSRGTLAGYPLIAGSGKSAPLLAHAVPGKDLLDGTRLAGSLVAARVAAGKKLIHKANPARANPGSKTDKVKKIILPSEFYALKAVQLSRRKGGAMRHLGLVDYLGRLHLYTAVLTTPTAVLPNSGLAFDLADLDDDGTLEVITTSADGPEVRDDRIYIRRQAGKRWRRVWRGRNVGGLVTALAHGDLNGDGRLELAAAVLNRKGRVEILVLD